MNVINITGNLTANPELKTSGERKFCPFTVAVRRDYKNASGEYETDFIDCVAGGGTAEFISKNFAKGQGIAISGALQSKVKEIDGKQVKFWSISVKSAEFNGGGKKQEKPADNGGDFGDDYDDFGL